MKKPTYWKVLHPDHAGLFTSYKYDWGKEGVLPSPWQKEIEGELGPYRNGYHFVGVRGFTNWSRMSPVIYTIQTQDEGYPIGVYGDEVRVCRNFRFLRRLSTHEIADLQNRLAL